MSCPRGLTPYAHLRLRDAKPGPGHYKVEPPRSQGKTISNHVELPKPWQTAVGPGEYQIPSTMGTGRCVRFPKHADDEEPLAEDASGGDVAFELTALRKEQAAKALARAARGEDILDPPQNSMALCPDSPRFTIYGRVKANMWVTTDHPNAGPASYSIRRDFDAVSKPKSAIKQTAAAPATHPSSTAHSRSAVAGGSRKVSEAEGSHTEGRSGGAARSETASVAPTQASSSMQRRKDSRDAWVALGTPGPDGTSDMHFGGSDAGSPTSPVIALHDTGRRVRSPPLGGTGPRVAKETASLGPGPLAYEDPSTIERRLGPVTDAAPRTVTAVAATHQAAASLRCSAAMSTFAGRNPNDGANPIDTAPPGPGPAAYSEERATAVLSQHAGKTGPRMMPVRFPPIEASPSRQRRMRRWKNRHGPDGPSSRYIPSDFDYDYRKGFTMLGPRYDPPVQPVAQSNRDIYDRTDIECSGRHPARRTRSVGFAAKPYDAAGIAAAKEAALRRAEELRASRPGPGGYDVRLDLAEKRSKGILIATAEEPPAPPGVPGPGHYRPDLASTLPNPSGTVFHKGSFAPPTVKADADPAPGPASARGPSEEDRATHPSHVKGFTFGTRYPARALHQVAPPKDEYTNTNCTYEVTR